MHRLARHSRRFALSMGVQRERKQLLGCRVITTDRAINIRVALAGMGITMVREDRVRDAIVKGHLVPALEEFSGSFPGYYLYYPQRRHASPALRAFVDYLRHARHEGHEKRRRIALRKRRT